VLPLLSSAPLSLRRSPRSSASYSGSITPRKRCPDCPQYSVQRTRLGLLVGAAVLFNGIRVGEITDLGLVADSPQQVDATIAVTSARRCMPTRKLVSISRADRRAGNRPGRRQTARRVNRDTDARRGPAAGQSMTQAARNALARVDSVLADNAEPLKSTIANLKIFTAGLAKNTGGLDGIVTGLEKMTGGGPAAAPKMTYDLRAPNTFRIPGR